LHLDNIHLIVVKIQHQLLKTFQVQGNPMEQTTKCNILLISISAKIEHLGGDFISFILE